MSAVPPATPLTPPAMPEKNQIVIVSHSNLFYWWPVWACGFIMAILTYFDKSLLAIVPVGTEAYQNARVDLPNQDLKNREVLVAPADKKLASRQDLDNPNSAPASPRLHIARTKNYGVLFATVLMLVIVITNVPLRGMWSFVVIILVVLLSVIFALAGWWEKILLHLSYLDIRINAGGYLFISGILFVIWLLTFIFFDRQVYMVFEPGQLRVCTEIGGGEHVYDATGMTLEKRRSDLFRHWILGFGSGDLVVKTAGAQAHEFDLPNVLGINRKKDDIEKLLKKRAVIESR